MLHLNTIYNYQKEIFCVLSMACTHFSHPTSNFKNKKKKWKNIQKILENPRKLESFHNFTHISSIYISKHYYHTLNSHREASVSLFRMYFRPQTYISFKCPRVNPSIRPQLALKFSTHLLPPLTSISSSSQQHSFNAFCKFYHFKYPRMFLLWIFIVYIYISRLYVYIDVSIEYRRKKFFVMQKSRIKTESEREIKYFCVFGKLWNEEADFHVLLRWVLIYIM